MGVYLNSESAYTLYKNEIVKPYFIDKTQMLEELHDTESPLLQYHHETELTAVVNLVYLAARDDYRVEREEKAGTGYADFIFYPKDPCADGIILELKADASLQEAVGQIRRKSTRCVFWEKWEKRRSIQGGFWLSDCL